MYVKYRDVRHRLFKNALCYSWCVCSTGLQCQIRDNFHCVPVNGWIGSEMTDEHTVRLLTHSSVTL